VVPAGPGVLSLGAERRTIGTRRLTHLLADSAVERITLANETQPTTSDQPPLMVLAELLEQRKLGLRRLRLSQVPCPASIAV